MSVTLADPVRSATEILVPIAATGLGLGLVGIAKASRSPALPGAERVRVDSKMVYAKATRFLAVVGAGVAVGLFTHMAVAAIAAMAAARYLPSLLSRSQSARQIEKREAVIEWAQAVRDLLAGGTALQGALLAACADADPVIEAELAGFSGALTRGAGLGEALVGLALSLDDPVADTVVAGLVLAARTRGERVADLLGSLVESATDEVAALRSTEADRAKPRSAMRFVVGFSIAVAALLFTVGIHYAAPYRSAAGEAVLAVVAAVFALGIWLMDQMTRPEGGARLGLTAQLSTQPGGAGRSGAPVVPPVKRRRG